MEFTEVKGDLFTTPQHFKLAHCISADCAMGAGIAKEFVRRNPGVRPYLRKLNPMIGEAILYKDGPEHDFFNLVTKQVYYQKPTYVSLHEALVSLKVEMKVDYYTNLTIPRIGCGLDKLDWDKTQQIIKGVFEGTPISIVAYYL